MDLDDEMGKNGRGKCNQPNSMYTPKQEHSSIRGVFIGVFLQKDFGGLQYYLRKMYYLRSTEKASPHKRTKPDSLTIVRGYRESTMRR